MTRIAHMPPAQSFRSATKAALLALLVLMVSACAPSLPRSYVVLVPDPDGAVGQVIVTGDKGSQVLSRSGQVAGADGRAVAVSIESPALDSTFGEARAAQPPQPEHFMLYFVSGGTRLTPESEDQFQKILGRWKSKDSNARTEVVVIGHTDTVGSADSNVTLSMQRAKVVADRLRASGLSFSALTLESHGEKHPLIPTKDGVAEPLNRRVQVTLR
jgi:outer membrane protein OmpA-like peptidoglycan-associated protein